jgi:pimeloyl-ACP methyl ester carboxylesterase
MAFRGDDEPWPDFHSIPAGVTIADAAAGAAYLGSWWREKAQADTLASGDVSRFSADVDFGKLKRRQTDNAKVPRTGPMDRILASHRFFGPGGIDYTKLCGGLLSARSNTDGCTGAFQGQLQPYALYVPKKPRPGRGWGFVLLMHSLSANYNQYANTRNQSQLGDRGQGSLVATPSGRGPDGSYRDIAEADSFEVWADVAHRYKLDPGLSVASGYSMGGLGTFRMLSRWPDLFARGFAVVGAGQPDEDLASMRNTPVMMWNATADELVNVDTYESTVRELTRLGLRFVSYVFLTADHLTLATSDQYQPGADWLGTHRVNRNPAHVTYVVDPQTDSVRAGSIADHAYWLSGLTVKKGATRGTIDVRSLGFGRGDAPVGQVQNGTGALQGGTRGPMPYVSQTLDWGKVPREDRQDKLIVKATDVTTATIDARRARVSCHPQVDRSQAPGLKLRIRC